ncbi:MAG: glycosyltransferase family 4 protein, partial [Ferruginibacter sp.]
DAEIILLPSLFESFSYTCAEAMAGGKAVIASSKTGMAEMLQHRETGVLVDAENITAIAEGIRLLILDNELRYTISENARNSITTKYNNHQLKEQYIYFYKSVVNTG